jgi:putative membrane protein
MSTIATIVIAIIALMHMWFLILEMFLWDKPTGRRAFGLTAEFAAQSKVLAANQGLYNGFLAAGLIWGLLLGNAEGTHVKIFFLACVLIAGVYGGFTATRKVLWIQALPAAIGLALVLLS